MGNPRSGSWRSAGVPWRRVNRRALRLAAFSVLLPVPVALAVPQSSLPGEQLVAMSQVPVAGVGDTVLPRVLPAGTTRKVRREDPAASMTRVASGKKAEKVSPSDIASNGIPAAALRAYRNAEATMGIADAGCGLSWGVLAGIGRVESDHGRFGGAVVGRDGESTPHILGVALDGAGAVSAIADTDNGRLDGDKKWDRAVGPMQFIPSTWALVGVDGDGDGTRDPHDLDDAALAAAAYLCAGGGDLGTPKGLHDAVFSYNHSEDYVALVVGVAKAYESGVVDLPLLAAPTQVASGPGVNVALGRPGRAVLIGASDDVSKDKDAKGEEGARDTKATQDTGRDSKAGGGASRDTDGPDRSGGQDPTRTGGTEPGGDSSTKPSPSPQRPSPSPKPAPEKPSPSPEKPSPSPEKPSPTPGNGGGTTQPPAPESPSPSEPTEPPAEVATGLLAICPEDEDQTLACLFDPDDPTPTVVKFLSLEVNDSLFTDHEGTVVTWKLTDDDEDNVWDVADPEPTP